MLAAIFSVLVIVGGPPENKVITLPDYPPDLTCFEMGPFNEVTHWGTLLMFEVPTGEKLSLKFVASPDGGGAYIHVLDCRGNACKSGEACS